MPASDDSSEDRPVSSIARAASSARQGDYRAATAWALVSIADDLAALRRDVHWSVRNVRK